MPKPKVFINNIRKEIKNNSNSFHFSRGEKEDIKLESNIDVRSKINEFFNSDSFVYKVKLDIYLNNGKTLKEDIIAVKDDNLITIDGTKIKINEILNIKKAN